MKQACYVCENSGAATILDRPPVRVWTNADDAQASDAHYPCRLLQCGNCGHVYQPIDKGLEDLLNLIYQSENAQLSTPVGKGNWGMQRAAFYCNHIDVKAVASVLEIGGGDGFILRYLQTQGVEKLVNIEPSLPRSYEADGILYLKVFASERVDLDTRFDLVFSIGVFEHIEKINDVLRFCSRHLSPGGQLLFSVPNADGCLRKGDPTLFVHQHIHYYTSAGVSDLLSRHGFAVKNIAANYDALIVSAAHGATEKDALPAQVSYSACDAQLEHVLRHVEALLQSPGQTIVHGANNALNNLLSWLGDSREFTLVDNDETKHGRIFFGREVRAMGKLDLSLFDRVVVIPHAFFGDIKSAYLKAGFKGEIVGILD